MQNRLNGTIGDIFRQADLVLLGLCCTACVYGIVMIYSASQYLGGSWDIRYIGVQSAAMLIGIVAYLGISMLDTEILMRRWKWIAAFNVIFILLLKTPLGRGKDGNVAWLKFPGFPVMVGPAEVVKITFVLVLAWQLMWLKEERRDLTSFSSALMAAGHALGMAGLYYMISGDMGNALMFILIFATMAFVAGFALRWFALLFGASGAAFALIWKLNLLPGYMRNRFLVVFDHTLDPRDAGWQQNRSLLTLGGGGLFGQGYLNGTQTQGGSGSIPARHTDLIFSVIGEELGLVGTLLVILLLAAIVTRILLVAQRAEIPFYMYICVGFAAMLTFQAIINIGMCLFIMPVIGLTLPFFSYGGSSVVTLFCAMGFVSGAENRGMERRRNGRI